MATNHRLSIRRIKQLVREALARPLPDYRQACAIAREAAARGVTPAFKALIEALKSEGLSGRDVYRLQRLVDAATQDEDGTVSLRDISRTMDEVLRGLYTDLGRPAA